MILIRTNNLKKLAYFRRNKGDLKFSTKKFQALNNNNNNLLGSLINKHKETIKNIINRVKTKRIYSKNHKTQINKTKRDKAIQISKINKIKHNKNHNKTSKINSNSKDKISNNNSNCHNKDNNRKKSHGLKCTKKSHNHSNNNNKLHNKLNLIR